MNPVRPPGWFYTYVLLSERTGRFYTGATHDLSQRVKQHAEELVRSTKHAQPLRLIYYEACRDKGDAFRRERYLKTGMGKRYLKNRLRRGLTG